MGKEAWCPPNYTTPSNFPADKSWISELSSEVLFVSVLAMVLSEYWKRKHFPPAFFNVLKEPFVVQKQTIPQQKALDFSFFSFCMTSIYLITLVALQLAFHRVAFNLLLWALFCLQIEYLFIPPIQCYCYFKVKNIYLFFPCSIIGWNQWRDWILGIM